MLNNQISQRLIKAFGNEKFKIFCFMEAEKNRIASEEFEKSHPSELNEFKYEAEWWENKYKELENINH